jgi:hypothetical protein
MYPLDQLTNATQPVTIAGRTLPVRQLRLREWGELQAWLKSVAPSPIAVAARGIAELRASGYAVPDDVQGSIYKQAQAEARTWPPRAGTMEWLKAVDTIEGGHARLILAAAAKGGTDLSEAEAWDMAESATSEELVDLVRVCVHGGHSVPKGVGEGTPPNPSPTPTTGDGSSSTSARSTG